MKSAIEQVATALESAPRVKVYEEHGDGRLYAVIPNDVADRLANMLRENDPSTHLAKMTDPNWVQSEVSAGFKGE